MCAIMDSVPTRADPQTTHCSSMWKERMCWFSELCCEKVPEQNSHLKVTSTLVVRPFLPPPPAFLAAEAASEAWWAWETRFKILNVCSLKQRVGKSSSQLIFVTVIFFIPGELAARPPPPRSGAPWRRAASGPRFRRRGARTPGRFPQRINNCFKKANKFYP